jgi:hypothetical protein
MIQFADID